jgi:hypothetical protein
MSDNTTYITLTKSEKNSLDEFIQDRFDSCSRISRGGAIRLLAEQELSE